MSGTGLGARNVTTKRLEKLGFRLKFRLFLSLSHQVLEELASFCLRSFSLPSWLHFLPVPLNHPRRDEIFIISEKAVLFLGWKVLLHWYLSLRSPAFMMTCWFSAQTSPALGRLPYSSWSEFIFLLCAPTALCAFLRGVIWLLVFLSSAFSGVESIH